MNRHTSFDAGFSCQSGDAGASQVPTECSSCEQPYDPAGWCEACQQFAHEQPPEKTLAQWIAENFEIAAAIKAQVFLEAQVRQRADGRNEVQL
jgi:hypothetical protein